MNTDQNHFYYPFGINFDGVMKLNTLHENRYQYDGKEFGIGLHDYGAQWYDASVGRFTTVDPLASDYSFQSPYAYATNNPVLFRDIMGMGVETTIVGDKGDGTYSVKKWIDDGKTDVITLDGTKIGQSLTHSFVGDDGLAIDGAIIDLSDDSGQQFFYKTLKGGRMWQWSYMPSATGGEAYDFKKKGMPIALKGDERLQYMYRGMLFDGKIASARDIGNFSAGAIAGYNGHDWSAARLGFDALQSWQAKRLETEGKPTQLAQKLGHNRTYPVWIEKEVDKIIENPMYHSSQKW